MKEQIEKGCLALVINSGRPENIGKCVTVGNFLGELNDLIAVDLWEVDVLQLAKYRYGGMYSDSGVYAQSEKNLMRIDNHQELKQVERQVERVE